MASQVIDDLVETGGEALGRDWREQQAGAYAARHVAQHSMAQQAWAPQPGLPCALWPAHAACPPAFPGVSAPQGRPPSCLLLATSSIQHIALLIDM